MKTILCFGDSNTWGYEPGTGNRYSSEQRWPGIMRDILGPSVAIIEEGLSGRTTVWDDPLEGFKNGKEYLIPCLQSQRPLDLIVLMLGTNDCKARFSLTPSDISAGVAVLGKIVLSSGVGPGSMAPLLLLVAPPPLGPLTDLAGMYKDGSEKSRQLSQLYKLEAEKLGCSFFDAGTVACVSDIDGVHLSRSSHDALGKAVSRICVPLLERS
jgi:lysophospholipase L1-like esterase